MFVLHQTNARFQSKLKFKTVTSNQTSPFNWNTYKITVWCGAANVHYCWTSIKSGKWPKHLIFIFFPPLDRYRFHRMRIICSWCLIQHLFSKGDAKKNQTITVFGWEFMLLCQWSNLKTRFTRCTCSFPQLFHSTFYWKICAFVQWCRCSSNILTVIFGYVCARARTQQRKKIWKTWSNVNTDIFEFRSFLGWTWKKKH